ncbi:fimbria/pilus outer membrane usher protein [Proteus vulgaris]
MGAWRVRGQSRFDWTKDRYQSKLSSIYAYRQINSFSSIFYGGNFSPTTRILPTDKIIGFQLISNNLISSNTLYANKPIIEGMADTEAQVVIRQGDKVIYETTVSSGSIYYKFITCFKKWKTNVRNKRRGWQNQNLNPLFYITS